MRSKKMALCGKCEDVKRVPWFSLTEWHQVYKQIYSNDSVEQTKGYERLLAWKARVPKLPVGVHCTLFMIQVCLRDREWTQKIKDAELAANYKNDLCLMYSSTIMRFLNNISNIGHTKQTSLFQIAKQLKLPEWIVDLRHDAAHGHELPSIGVLRIAINILLAWIHDEYWVTEGDNLEECCLKRAEILEREESDEAQALADLFELWTAVSLYLYADYELVSDIPDTQLRETLYDLRAYKMSLPAENKDAESDDENRMETEDVDIKNGKEYSLSTAQDILLTELSRYLGKYKSIPDKENVVLNALFDCEVFLPSEDTLTIFSQNQVHGIESRTQFPPDMIAFWRDIIVLLQKKDMLEPLILKLLELVDEERETDYRRFVGSLWISSIAYGFLKLDVAQTISQMLEQKQSDKKKTFSAKLLDIKIKEEICITRPDLKHVLCLDTAYLAPRFLTDINFVSELILKANEFYAKFLPPLLELAQPELSAKKKRYLSELIDIYALGKGIEESGYTFKELFLVGDLSKLCLESYPHPRNKNDPEDHFIRLEDRTIRNTHWKLADVDHDWSGCPIGVLPWQIDTTEILEPLSAFQVVSVVPTLDSDITPGIIDTRDLKMRSKVVWKRVLRRKRKSKRKRGKESGDVIINKAIEVAKQK